LVAEGTGCVECGGLDGGCGLEVGGGGGVDGVGLR